MTIGEKIRDFGNKNFNTLTEFAEALDMKLPSLYSYINDRSLPGALILKKLLDMGCDLNWLLKDDNDNFVFEREVSYTSELVELKKEVRKLHKIIEKIKLEANKIDQK